MFLHTSVSPNVVWHWTSANVTEKFASRRYLIAWNQSRIALELMHFIRNACSFNLLCLMFEYTQLLECTEICRTSLMVQTWNIFKLICGM